MRLSPEDRAKVRGAAEELPLTEERVVSHGFSFPFNRDGARYVGDELRRHRFLKVWVGEETSGDEYWHVWGLRRQCLTPRVVVNTRRQMEALARRAGGTYDGWSIKPVGFSTAIRD